MPEGRHACTPVPPPAQGQLTCSPGVHRSFGVVDDEWSPVVVGVEVGVEADIMVDIDDVTVTSPFVPASSAADDPDPQAKALKRRATA